ncbi:MAG TPA: Uma2 family endonuclease [Pirellulaceae bacterium]|nr:Uma2 family endonuclease [Pirellulaceae bacterium]
MSVGFYSQLRARPQRDKNIPLLYSGDRLDQPEFHRRYEAYPANVHFELIGGIVYTMTPPGYDHGKGDYGLTGIFFQYELATPGVEGAQNVSIILGKDEEPQPDVVMMLKPECGGRTRIEGDETKYIVGPPELVVEVAYSSAAIDLHEKRRDYRKGGVAEYIVVDLSARRVHWFDLASDRKLKLPADAILRCKSFPGLWIDSAALLDKDNHRLFACLQRGLKSREHRQLVARLKDLMSRSKSRRRRSNGAEKGESR